KAATLAAGGRALPRPAAAGLLRRVDRARSGAPVRPVPAERRAAGSALAGRGPVGAGTGACPAGGCGGPLERGGRGAADAGAGGCGGALPGAPDLPAAGRASAGGRGSALSRAPELRRRAALQLAAPASAGRNGRGEEWKSGYPRVPTKWVVG